MQGMLLFDQVQETKTFLKGKGIDHIDVALIFGTGLSAASDLVEDPVHIPYAEIPHFPATSVKSHAGHLISGRVYDVPVLVMAGRFHYYEGYPMQQITLPVRVFAELGCTLLIVTNAAGGLNAAFYEGDLVVISDHINLMGDNPLRGPHDARFGDRFPDLLDTYTYAWRALVADFQQSRQWPQHTGVYAALSGPSLETPAEYAYLHHIGADLVGMSTVPEAIVAKQHNMAVLGLSVVSNRCYPKHALSETTVDDVIEVVNRSVPAVRDCIAFVLKKFSTGER